MTRQRARIRFRKQDDLRWISHRDLVRAFERMMRRAAMPLSMSEGFHPKPRINFPSALSLGIAAHGEWVEVELSEVLPADQIQQRLAEAAPPGLVIDQVQIQPAGQKKAQAVFQSFELPVPDSRRPAARTAVRQFLDRSSVPLTRPGSDRSIDVRAGVDSLELADDGCLRMRLVMSSQASVHPRDVLRCLALDDLEQSGSYLIRTEVELLS